MVHTPGPWRAGKNAGTVVCDTQIHPDHDSGHNCVEYYGGHLVAESIWIKEDVQLISAAAELLEASELLVDALHCLIDADVICNSPQYMMIKQAIAKAKGEEDG